MMPKTKKNVIVHLGNAGDKKNGAHARKTGKLTEKFSAFTFIGIDQKKIRANRPNWKQKKADIVEGLSRIKDNSVRIISSDATIGYLPSMDYKRNPMQQTEQTARIALKKLVKGGKLLISVDEKIAGNVVASLYRGGFAKEKVEIREFTEIEYQRTAWTKELGSLGLTLCQITAKK
jgi:hypothetical protein